MFAEFNALTCCINCASAVWNYWGNVSFDGICGYAHIIGFFFPLDHLRCLVDRASACRVEGWRFDPLATSYQKMLKLCWVQCWTTNKSNWWLWAFWGILNCICSHLSFCNTEGESSNIVVPTGPMDSILDTILEIGGTVSGSSVGYVFPTHHTLIFIDTASGLR